MIAVGPRSRRPSESWEDDAGRSDWCDSATVKEPVERLKA
jgi:hypothetical protein